MTNRRLFVLCAMLLTGQVAFAQGEGGGVFTNTGSNSCAQATLINVPVGPPGSPQTITIHGNNSTATENDCIPPFGYHDGPVWWERIQINQRARITIDLCGTTPVQELSYNLMYTGCSFSNSFCFNTLVSDESDRGAPFCGDGNIWYTFTNLEPGMYRIPILSDPAVLPGGVGPYTMHITAEACPGACCHTNEHTCDDCANPPTCVGPGDQFHAQQSCAQVECASVIGPDVIVAVYFCEQTGRIGPVGSGTVAIGCNTTACNIGDKRGDWFALPDTNHPVIGVNMYRMETVNGASRFEQLGHSWLKHGFGSANADECGLGCTPGAPFEQIGVGCSDTYSGLQLVSCNLGPRSMIHPYTGVMPQGPDLGPMSDCEDFTSDPTHYPANDHRDHVHTPVSHKPQIQESDLDPALHPGARYFVEGFYIAPHEFNQGNGNQNNNVGHVELAVFGPDVDGVYHYPEAGPLQLESPAVDAWTGSSQSMIEPAPLADGRAFVAWQATDLGGGQWHYEYAAYNMNMDASIGSLCVPLAPGTTLSNVGFYAPRNHDPELHADTYSNDPWTPTITSDAIRWDTETFANNPFANAVRFGTLYNFRFDANVAPQSVNGAVGLFKTSGTVAVALQGPSPAVPVDVNANGIPDVCETAVPPTPLADPSGINKARFISLSIPADVTASAAPTALRVRLVSLHHVDPPYTGGPSVPFAAFEGQVRWAGPPGQCLAGCETPPFKPSILQCTPHYRDWSTEGLIHLTGSAITPSSIYQVESVSAACTGNEVGCAAVSAPLEIRTTRWGDVQFDYNPPAISVQPDITDVSSLVDKFRSTPGAVSKSRGILAGVAGDPAGEMTHTWLSVDFSFSHISSCVDAFRGVPYPYTISACP